MLCDWEKKNLGRVYSRLPGFFCVFYQVTWFSQKMYQITWCAQPGGPDYLVFTKFAPDYLVPPNRGDQITWATFGHKVDQITW